MTKTRKLGPVYAPLNADKHTPGPWKFEHSKESFGVKIKDSRSKAIAAISGTVKRSSEECTANARLIAAAPELLEALELALSYMPNQRTEHNVRETVQAAIAKARGQ